jgi:phosphatidylserine decarboxylase
MAKADLTAARLREVFHYEPLTGVFTRRIAGGTRTDCIGEVASRAKRYECLHVDGVQYRLHRLVFLYMTGQWPTMVVDHINGDKRDNKWSNLRDVPQSHNVQNQMRATCSNRSCGALGVNKNGHRYYAAIGVGGRRIKLGSFSSVEEAHAAYVEAKRKYHQGCTI